MRELVYQITYKEDNMASFTVHGTVPYFRGKTFHLPVDNDWDLESFFERHGITTTLKIRSGKPSICITIKAFVKKCIPGDDIAYTFKTQRNMRGKNNTISIRGTKLIITKRRTVMRRKHGSLRNALLETIRTEPKPLFTSEDIYDEVLTLIPDLTKQQFWSGFHSAITKKGFVIKMKDSSRNGAQLYSLNQDKFKSDIPKQQTSLPFEKPKPAVSSQLVDLPHDLYDLKEVLEYLGAGPDLVNRTINNLPDVSRLTYAQIGKGVFDKMTTEQRQCQNLANEVSSQQTGHTNETKTLRGIIADKNKDIEKLNKTLIRLRGSIQSGKTMDFSEMYHLKPSQKDDDDDERRP